MFIDSKVVTLKQVISSTIHEPKTMRDKLVRIYTGTEVTCIALKGELEAIGIESMMKNPFQISTGYVGATPENVDVFILESDLEKASPVIVEFQRINQD